MTCERRFAQKFWERNRDNALKDRLSLEFYGVAMPNLELGQQLCREGSHAKAEGDSAKR